MHLFVIVEIKGGFIYIVKQLLQPNSAISNGT